MTDIASVDKNFNFPTQMEKEDIKFYSVKEEPFKVYGICFDNDRYRRLPEEVAKTVNKGVLYFHANTAGGSAKAEDTIIDNVALTALCGCEGIVDGTHPTDYGLASMAKAIGDVLETIFKKQGWI